MKVHLIHVFTSENTKYAWDPCSNVEGDSQL